MAKHAAMYLSPWQGWHFIAGSITFGRQTCAQTLWHARKLGAKRVRAGLYRMPLHYYVGSGCCTRVTHLRTLPPWA